MNEVSIGKFIERHRKESGFKSQRQLAEKTGISSATISRIESDIQRPIPETLKELSKHLNSTSYVELMVNAGYWDEEELLEPNGEKNGSKVKETPSAYAAEKEFVNNLELSDEKLLKEFNLQLDGKPLSKDEAKGVIAYLRSLRQFDQ